MADNRSVNLIYADYGVMTPYAYHDAYHDAYESDTVFSEFVTTHCVGEYTTTIATLRAMTEASPINGDILTLKTKVR